MFIKKIRVLVFVKNRIYHAAVELCVTGDDADIRVSVIPPKNQLFDFTRGVFTLVIGIVSGIEEDSLGCGFGYFKILAAAEHARFQQ